jgi:hypothetical protein
MILAGGLVCIILFFARNIYTTSVDLGWHYALIEFIVEHASLPPPEVVRLGPMIEYPPGAHVLTAILAVSVGTSPLRMLFFCSIVSILLLYFLVLALLKNPNRAACVVTATSLIFLLLILRGTSMLIGNEIINNFFYPQLLGDLGFVLLLILVSKITRPAIVGMIAVVAVYALAWVYTASAVKLALSIGLLQLLALTREYARDRIFLSIALAVLLPLVIFTHPTFEPMLRNAAHDGAISITMPLVVASSVLLLLLAPSIWWLKLRVGSAARCEPFVAAGIAVALLALMQFGVWEIISLGSPYAVKKHGFMIGTFIAANLAVCATEIASRTRQYRQVDRWLRFVPISIIRWTTACLAVIAVLPWQGEPVTAVIRYDNEVRAIVATGNPQDLLGRTISVNRQLPLGVNFAVALAVLQLPGWGPAAGDQFAALRMTEPIPSGIQYAVIAPPVSDLSVSCLIEAPTEMQLQLVRRDCVNSSAQ